MMADHPDGSGLLFHADRARLSSRVASHLRDLIMSGQLAPNERLRLNTLSSSLGVSTTPVREALLVLEGEGLVASEPHRGYVVKALSPRDILDVYDVHAHIAGILADRAARELTDEELDRLSRIQQATWTAAHAGDGARVVELNSEFHRIINRAGHSPILARIIAQTTHYVSRRYYGVSEGWLDVTAERHGPILEALRKGDGRSARTLTTAHIREGGRLLVEHFRAHGRWTPAQLDGLDDTLATTDEANEGARSCVDL